MDERPSNTKAMLRMGRDPSRFPVDPTGSRHLDDYDRTGKGERVPASPLP